MNLVTQVETTPFAKRISRESNILLLGSCFSTNIGQMLCSHGFNTLINPFGVLYNPSSIAACLERIAAACTNRPTDTIIWGNAAAKNGPGHTDVRKVATQFGQWPYFTSDDVLDISLNSTIYKSCIIQDASQFPGAITEPPTKKTTKCEASRAADQPTIEAGSFEETKHKSPHRYCSFHHHSSFAENSPEEFLESANKTLTQAAEFLQKADTVIITLGTSYVFRHIERDMIVANCHKINPKEFSRELLSTDEAAECLRRICSAINNATTKDSDIATAGNTHIIFTVSPIRHLADGAHGNLISKSTLLHAIDRITSSSNHVSYFPSYEIMMDELRDYRFYAEDMVHPSETAVKYIFERFKETAVAMEDYEWMQQEHKKWLRTQHRPFT